MKRGFLLIATVLLLGCASTLKRPPLQTVSPGNLPDWFPTSARYPEKFNATQRVLLTANNKEYDFTASLQKDKQELRAVVLAEMGSLFLYLNINGNKVEIVKNPSGLPENPLRDGVAGDIRFLFDRDTLFLGWSWLQNAQRTLLVQRRGTRQIVWQADSAQTQAALATEVENDRTIRLAHFQEYRFFDSIGRTLPATIVIENRRWHYTLRVQLLEIHPSKAGTL